jgi:hypothetical protein
MSEETRTLLEVLSLLDRMYCQAVEEDPDFPTKIGVGLVDILQTSRSELVLVEV